VVSKRAKRKVEKIFCVEVVFQKILLIPYFKSSQQINMKIWPAELFSKKKTCFIDIESVYFVFTETKEKQNKNIFS
jgi:hypothetical protein